MRIFLFITLLLWGGAAVAQTAQVVDATGVNMRSGKAENYRIIRVLPPHTEVRVVEVGPDYTKVRTAEGEAGWVLTKLLVISKAEEEKADQNQAALEEVKKELVAAQVEVANLQRELENSQHPGSEGAPRPLPSMLLVALGAFAAGIVLGILMLRAYYQRRLHGLRI